MATKRVKSAVPRAAKVGSATRSVSSSTAAMRAKLRLRVMIGSPLEPVAEVQADQVGVGLIRPVEVVRAASLRAAGLEMQREFRGVHHPRPAMEPHAEGDADAV